MANKQHINLAMKAISAEKLKEDDEDYLYCQSFNKGAMGEFYGKKLTSKSSLEDSFICPMSLNLYKIHTEHAEDEDRNDKDFEEEKLNLKNELEDTAKRMLLKIDSKENDKWMNKYFRNSAVHVFVNKVDKDSGFTISFTLLFENNFSMTFR